MNTCVGYCRSNDQMPFFVSSFLHNLKGQMLCGEKLRLSIFMAAPTDSLEYQSESIFCVIVFYTHLIKDQHYCCLYWPLQYKMIHLCLVWGAAKWPIFIYFKKFCISALMSGCYIINNEVQQELIIPSTYCKYIKL